MRALAPLHVARLTALTVDFGLTAGRVVPFALDGELVSGLHQLALDEWISALPVEVPARNVEQTFIRAVLPNQLEAAARAEQVLVQGTPVASLAEVEAAEGNLIEPLAAALKAQTDRALIRAAATDLSAREITILGDRDVPYRVLKKVMATCTEADYGKLSLAVVQREEAMTAVTAGT